MTASICYGDHEGYKRHAWTRGGPGDYQCAFCGAEWRVRYRKERKASADSHDRQPIHCSGDWMAKWTGEPVVRKEVAKLAREYETLCWRAIQEGRLPNRREPSSPNPDHFFYHLLACDPPAAKRLLEGMKANRKRRLARERQAEDQRFATEKRRRAIAVEAPPHEFTSTDPISQAIRRALESAHLRPGNEAVRRAMDAIGWRKSARLPGDQWGCPCGLSLSVSPEVRGFMDEISQHEAACDKLFGKFRVAPLEKGVPQTDSNYRGDHERWCLTPLGRQLWSKHLAAMGDAARKFYKLKDGQLLAFGQMAIAILAGEDAIATWNPDRGAITTWINRRVPSRVTDLVRKEGRYGRRYRQQPEDQDLCEIPGKTAFGRRRPILLPDYLADVEESLGVVNDAVLLMLSDRDVTVIDRRFAGATLDKIAAEMGLVPQRVHQIYDRSIKRLQIYAGTDVGRWLIRKWICEGGRDRWRLWSERRVDYHPSKLPRFTYRWPP